MSDTSQPTLGVVGLGAMGGAIAGRLVASGFDVVVYDTSPEAVQRLVDLGAAAGDLAKVAGAQVVVLSLPNDAVVLSVVDELAPVLTARTLIEMSSTLPETARALADRLGGSVPELVDAPVSGGPADATAGTLSLLVGADGELSDAAQQVLGSVGTINRVGRFGDGKIVKLINNMMAMGNVAVAVEAFQLGVNLGVEPKLLYDVISRSGGRSNHFNKRVPWVLDDDFTARFAVRLGEKDMRLGLELAHGASYPTPVAATVHQVFESAMSHQLADEDVVALIKVYRR